MSTATSGKEYAASDPSSKTNEVMGAKNIP